MIDPALRASLAGYDDAALATLANPGLVRRAHRDLADGKVRLVAASGGKAEVEADGHLVAIDKKGPRAAECACKSATVCRHRIAAVLFLLAASDTAEAAAREDTPAADPQGIIATLDLAALERWAGKASWRAALELAGAPATVDPQPNAIAVSLEGLDEPVLILRGQSIDGIVSKAAKAQRKAMHAAAVLAARRHFALPVPDAGEDAAEPETAARFEPDPEFLAQIVSALGEVAALGFNLAPVPLEESLFELSVSSRADSLPRLAALLRAIAARIRQRRQRSLEFDPDAMLELAATALALTRALGSGSDERQGVLAGKVRRSFEPSEPLELIGCGGERWRTATGARGVTAWFIEVQSGRWLSTTLARGPGQDPQFMPGEAWQHQSMWQAAPLARLAHAHFALEHASISDDGRLSAPAAARATIHQADVKPSSSSSAAVRTWAELRGVYLQQAGLGLDTGASAAACLLAPTQTAAPFFDDFAQHLVWPVRDETGAWLALTLEPEEPVATAIEALEASAGQGWKGLILAKVSRDKHSLAVTPVTLLGEAKVVDLTFWQRPHRAAAPTRPSWLERLRPRSAQVFAKAARDGTQAALDAAWQHLVDRLEAGPGLMAAMDGERAAQAGRLDTFGLPLLADLLRKASSAETMLIAAYALLIARQQRCGLPLVVQSLS